MVLKDDWEEVIVAQQWAGKGKPNGEESIL